MIQPHKTHLIWDWNGTLLDDVDYGVAIINDMLRKRALPELTMERYRETFGFPIQDYYRKLGFDFEREPYEQLAMEFINPYYRNLHNCTLQPRATHVLESFQARGIRQSILTAANGENISRLVQQLGIERWFDTVLGAKDHFAHGKGAIGKAWLAEHNIDPHRAVLVGDTEHDYEVAQEMGIDCILVSHGHHGRERLARIGAPVIDHLTKLLD